MYIYIFYVYMYIYMHIIHTHTHTLLLMLGMERCVPFIAVVIKNRQDIGQDEH